MNKKLIAIMQPTFNPWLGFFDIIDKVDEFVFFDDTQLVKRSWQVRNKIKSNELDLLLTIPIIKTKSRDDLLIKDAVINYTVNWVNKHLKSITFSYSKSAYFDEVFPIINEHYQNRFELLVDFNIKLIERICEILGINTSFRMSSDLHQSRKSKDEKLVDYCTQLKADVFLSASGSSKYIEAMNPGGAFSNTGIDLYYHSYNHPLYKQLGKNFIPYLGIMDLLFCEGFNNTLNIIKLGRRDNIHYLNLQNLKDEC